MKYNKYKNKKVEIDGFKFDSKKEANRYLELKLLQRAKKISELTLQPSYILQESFKLDGKTHRSIKYISDFRYVQDGITIVEDVKASATFLTDVYKIKKKLFLFKYGSELVFKEMY